MARAAEVPATLERAREFARHDLRIESRCVNLSDFESRIVEVEVVLQTALQFVDDLALAADHHAHALGVKGDLGALGGALEVQTAEAGALRLGKQEFLHQTALDIAVDELANGTQFIRHQ